MKHGSNHPEGNPTFWTTGTIHFYARISKLDIRLTTCDKERSSTPNHIRVASPALPGLGMYWHSTRLAIFKTKESKFRTRCRFQLEYSNIWCNWGFRHTMIFVKSTLLFTLRSIAIKSDETHLSSSSPLRLIGWKCIRTTKKVILCAKVASVNENGVRRFMFVLYVGFYRTESRRIGTKVPQSTICGQSKRWDSIGWGVTESKTTNFP